ncbi:hypothetical protein CCB80_08655 [Armatimonadetes bacterium Uphvl-Ar1]|nr:hypothetical protein CCB80_08655 [Armatimonadetes bacterium Uphvl-Ar1]
MFEIGSLRHGTGVWQHSDADYLVSLKGSQPSSPWTMLNKVKESLQGRFPTTTIQIRRPAVVCQFSDGIVEVIPGYIFDGDDKGYRVASPIDGWMNTFPEKHNEYVNGINSTFNGGAKQLARFMKIWKYRRNVPVSSCYLEMRAAQHLSGEASYVPVWDIYQLLKKLHDHSLASMNDPSGLGSRFTSCSTDASKADAMSKLSTAVARAEKAKNYHRNEDHSNAIAQLELLFNR